MHIQDIRQYRSLNQSTVRAELVEALWHAKTLRQAQGERWLDERCWDIRWFFNACLRAILVSLAGWCSVAQAAEGPSYTAALATMYNEYQRVLMVRDACIVAQPAKRDEFAGAYKDWWNRHVRIVDDLDNRFAAIVKRASKDQAEYTRAYAKHQSEVLQMREENKRALLANRESLVQQCGEFAAYVRHPKSDIPALFPAEFKSVYRPR
jgi:hypothetical protein